MSGLFTVKEKTVVITGGAGVLCGRLACALAREGAKVAILDFNEKGAREVVREIKSRGGSALAVKVDILDKDALHRAKDLVRQEFGQVDILINGAGGNHPRATTTKEQMLPGDLVNKSPEMKTFFHLETEGIQFVFNLNFLGVLLTTQVFGENMVAQGRGVILNISSMNALRPLTKIPAYSAAKAAISNFTQWLAVHFSSAGIRVNAIAPGFFLTAQNRFLLTEEKTGELTERGKKIVAHTPAGRFGDPEDLVGTVLWLVSDASQFVTGVVVPVDGGFSAFSGV